MVEAKWSKMMSDSRSQTLARLREQQHDLPMPAQWQSRRHYPDLAAQFTQALTVAHGEVWHAGTSAHAQTILHQLLQKLQPQKLVLNDEQPLTEWALPTQLPDLEWFTVGQTAGNLRAFCEQADVGISAAEAALAETGSVIVHSGQGQSRLVTLLPPVHIALVSTSRLTTDIFTWVVQKNGKMPANLVLITGPSKTADIEQTMAIGVHGPQRFIVVLYDEPDPKGFQNR